MEYTLPKGVFDILPMEAKEEDFWRTSEKWFYLEEMIRKTAEDYGYREIRTPIFERTELFIRGVGESSDIVTKEMYTFTDKGDRSMTLRPEGTAPVIRAFIEKHLEQTGSVHKFYYIGPMFRYDRPQAGRYRQFHQFGAEAIGVKAPEQDAEVIDMLYELYQRLHLKDLLVIINSVGDPDSRTPYKQALQDYLMPHFDELSKESQFRIQKNPLRILDSKDEKDQKLLQKAPLIDTFFNEECRDHFADVQRLLKSLRIPFIVNPRLVRGLDYYNKTVFEITSGGLGSQNSIVGGGRYDGLMANLGGPNLPAIGFATGMERILQTMMNESCPFPAPPRPFVFFIPLGDKAKEFCFAAIAEIRHTGLPAEIDLTGKKMQHALQRADHLKVDYCAVIGDEEMDSGQIKLKDMFKREVMVVEMKNLLTTLQKLWNQKK